MITGVTETVKRRRSAAADMFNKDLMSFIQCYSEAKRVVLEVSHESVKHVMIIIIIIVAHKWAPVNHDGGGKCAKMVIAPPLI